MHLLYMIFIFILSLNSFGEGYFKEFVIGENLEKVKEKLLFYKIIIDKEDIKTFKMDVPLFLYLKMAVDDNNIQIDPEAKRIYLDDYTFFDFNDIVIQTKDFFFFNEKGVFYIEFKNIKSFSITEPKRVNPKLETLKLKFFKDVFYCIEYKANLSPFEINRFIENYKTRYGVDVNKTTNKFETDTTLFFIDLSEKSIRLIMIDKKIMKQIENSINDITKKVVIETTKKIQEYVNHSLNLDKLWLQYKKNILNQSLKKIYSDIDEL